MPDSDRMTELKQISQEAAMLDMNAAVEEGLPIEKIFLVVDGKFEDSFYVDVVTLDELPSEALAEVMPVFERKPDHLCVPVLYSLDGEDSVSYMMLEKGSFAHPLLNGNTVPIYADNEPGSQEMTNLQIETLPLLGDAVRRILARGDDLTATLFLVDSDNKRIQAGREKTFLENPDLLPEAARAVEKLPRRPSYARTLYVIGKEFAAYNVILPDESLQNSGAVGSS